MTITIRKKETIRVQAVALDQDGRPAYLANQQWYADGFPFLEVAGDPSYNHAIATSSVANPSVITTSLTHGFETGDRIYIHSHVGSTPDITGFHIITKISTTQFSIPVNVTVGGTGGVAYRANASIVEVNPGPPPDKVYDADLTGENSGSGKILLAYDDPELAAHYDYENVIVLNASSIIFDSGYIVNGVLILDFQDGVGPGPIDIRAIGIDSRGASWTTDQDTIFEYDLTNFQWTDPDAKLVLTNPTSQIVTVEADHQGNGTLQVSAKNSAGVTITGSLPYRVLMVASLTFTTET